MTIVFLLDTGLEAIEIANSAKVVLMDADPCRLGHPAALHTQPVLLEGNICMLHELFEERLVLLVQIVTDEVCKEVNNKLSISFRGRWGHFENGDIQCFQRLLVHDVIVLKDRSHDTPVLPM